MLAPEPMVRLEAVLLERDERAALEALGDLGQVELAQGPADPGTAARPARAPGGGPTPWDAILDRVQRLRSALGLPGDAAPAIPGSLEALEMTLGGFETRAAGLLARRDALRLARTAQSDRALRLARWGGLGLAAARLEAPAGLLVRIGTAPQAALDALAAAAPGALLLALPARPGEGRRALVALAGERGRATLERALQAEGFQPEELPAGAGGATLDALAAAAAQEAARLEAEERAVDERLGALGAEAGPALAALEARAGRERRLAEAAARAPRTRTALLLRGWSPAAEAPGAMDRLRTATGGRCALAAAAPGRDEEDEVPVLLRAPRWLRPFQLLATGFGLPRYRELSPAPFLAVSYLAMFGMMFGDVGHGLVLALAGLLLRRGRAREAGPLLVGCGLSSAAFGAAYGSWFGLARLRRLALWRDPLEGDPLRFMAAAVAVGVVLISLGLCLRVVDRLRHRDLPGALLDRFGLAGLAFYWGALACVGGWVLRGVPPGAPAALLLLPAAAWILHEPVAAAGHRRRGARPAATAPGLTASLAEALETVLAYLASTISFVRLAAYAMSHAALLLAVALLVATLVGPGGRPGPAAWAVAVAGHAVAILLEGVVAGVQALRLEYHEFFGKFFSGAGRPFAPFRLDPAGGGA